MGNNKGRNNYFDQSIKQFGDNFLSFISPDRIQKAAKSRIFREMAQGMIDYGEYGKYFTDPKFFENLLIAANDELQNNMIIQTALMEFDLHHPNIQQIIILKGRYTNLTYAFRVIVNVLNAVKFDGYNISYLSDLSSMIGNYKNIL